MKVGDKVRVISSWYGNKGLVGIIDTIDFDYPHPYDIAGCDELFTAEDLELVGDVTVSASERISDNIGKTILYYNLNENPVFDVICEIRINDEKQVYYVTEHYNDEINLNNDQIIKIID